MPETLLRQYSFDIAGARLPGRQRRPRQDSASQRRHFFCLEGNEHAELHKGAGAEGSQGKGRGLHQALVHGHPRPDDEFRHNPRRARGSTERGNGIRWILDHRLSGHPGKRYDGPSRPLDFLASSLAAPGDAGRQDVLRHQESRWLPLRGGSALHPPPGGRQGREYGLHVLCRTGAGVFLLQDS